MGNGYGGGGGGGGGGMLGTGNVLGQYMHSEEADSNRPIAGINPKQLGILEQMGIYSPAQKQAMQFAQNNADDLAQRAQDLQEAQLSTGLASPAFYGIRASRQFGGMLGTLAGGGQQALQQQMNPQIPDDPAFQIVQGAMASGNPSDYLGNLEEAGKRMTQAGDPRGLKLLQYAAEAKSKLEKEQAETASANASAASSLSTAKVNELKAAGTLPAEAPQEGKTYDYVDAKDGNKKVTVAYLNGKWREVGRGIPTSNSNVKQTNYDGTPVDAKQASTNYSKLEDMGAVTLQAADLMRGWEDRVTKDPDSAGWTGDIASKAVDLSANVKGLLNMATTMGKTVDESVQSALGPKGDLSHFATIMEQHGINGALNQKAAITLAYLLAAQDQKTASISDTDIKYYLEMVGAKHTDVKLFHSMMDSNRQNMLSKVDSYALTHDDGKERFADKAPYKVMRAEIQRRMYPNAQTGGKVNLKSKTDDELKAMLRGQ